MFIRKGAWIGLIVLAILAGWFSKTIAQQSSSSPVVTYFDHAKVDEAAGKRVPLIVGQAGNANYKVVPARRDGPGEAEIHNLDADVIYVVSGTATFITGGSAVSPKTTAPDEIRSQSIQGGESHHLSKGDVIIIPAGVPHWFKEVDPPFNYFVVKVR